MPSPGPDPRRQALAGLAGLALLLLPGCSPARTAQADPQARTEASQPDPPTPGANTHFSQGWPSRLMGDAQALGVTMVRDSVHWAKVEATPGRYDFTAGYSGHVDQLCRLGISVLLIIEPRNPLYDSGQTAYSAAAQQAFAQYLKAIADRWPGCVVGFEIGNEINGSRGMTGPAATDRIRAHVSLLKAVHAAIKPGHPHLAVLGGSTNAIGTGMLKQLIAAGMLQWVDGLAIHPYRLTPEGMDWELDHLREVVARSGRDTSIWATEFTREFDSPDQAPPFFLKMVALLESRGIGRHFWYAMVDQTFFPTMGLARFNGIRKPAGEAFAFYARTLAPLGLARRIDHGDPALYDFRFGTDTHVVWGGARTLTLPPSARAFAATGAPIPVPKQVSDAPVILRNAPTITFGPPQVLADSLYGFGSGSLAWFVRLTNGKLLPTATIDTKFASYLGAPGAPVTAVNPAGLGASPARAGVVRFTATQPMSPAIASFCLLPIGTASAGVALMRNDVPVWQGQVRTNALSLALPVALAAGDRLDLIVGNAPVKAGRFRYRFRISTTRASSVDCDNAGIDGLVEGAAEPVP